VTPNAPRALPLSDIEVLARRVRNSPGRLAVFAGTPASVAAPQGMSEILRRSHRMDLGTTGGLTLIQNSAAFTPPRLEITTRQEAKGYVAVVQRTQTEDVVHESFYPAAGDHIRPGMKVQDGNRTIQYYWRVSGEMSELIRKGEQEHLDDAHRAFELTYLLVAQTINSVAGKPFGPASSADAAQQSAKTALEKILPRQLGVDPTGWADVLDRLLLQTASRDTLRWHSVVGGPPVTEGDKVILPIIVTDTTKIGRIRSSQVVNY
jgi:hypothetical protein